MTLQQFVKIAQNYSEIAYDCDDTSVVDIASDMLQASYNSLNDDDKHTINVLCDSNIICALVL